MAGIAGADDSDPVRDRLDQVLETYSTEQSAAREEMLRAVDERIRVVASRGELDAVTALQRDRRRYEEFGVLPNDLSLRRVVNGYRRR